MFSEFLNIVIFFIILIINIILNKIYINILRSNSIYASVNSRSLHSKKIPTSGGIIFGISISLYLIILSLDNLYFFISLIPLVVFLIVCFIDDLYNIHSLKKLILYSLNILFFLFLIYYYHIDVKKIDFNLFLYFVLLFFSILWFVNLFNFMDGSDGLVICHSLMFFLSLISFIFLNNIESLLEHFFIFNIIAILLAFAFFNLPPARIFMGDTGSIFLGFLIVIFSIYFYDFGIINLHIFLILNSFFIIDTSIGILEKIVSKENILKAHKKHFYQQIIENKSSKMTSFEIEKRKKNK